jgi:hypothetical protein
MFASRKIRIALGIAAFALMIGMSGFAFSRGYFMRFVVEGQALSRDQFYDLANRAAQDPSIRVACAQGEWAVGWLYVYEVHCFDTQDEVIAYMKLSDG